jgi:hypothetical protein
MGFTSGEPDPDITPVAESFRPAFDHFAEMARRPPVVTHIDLANAALACRAGEHRPELISQLEEAARDDSEAGRVARFLLALVEQAALPDVPTDLNDDLRHMLVHVGVAAACAPLMLHDLAKAVLNQRWYSDPLDEHVAAALDVLGASGEPFASIASYFSELAHRNLWPQMPWGIPRQTLALLASARRHASEFSRRVIGIGRSHLPRQGEGANE